MLKEYNNEEQTKADTELNTLENQVLMIGYTFYHSNKNEVEDLYNKLDMILGYKDEERKRRGLPIKECSIIKRGFRNYY